MGKRRKSRELALQALFYMDASGDDSEERLLLFCKSRLASQKTPSFFYELVRGVVFVKPQIDAFIERFSSNWKISRMSRVDRNLLRIAVYEMMCRNDIPVKVSINEAIDIGKKYGTEESGAFINGILDGIRSASEVEEIHITLPVKKPQQDPIYNPTSITQKKNPPKVEPRFSQVKGKNGIVKRRSESRNP